VPNPVNPALLARANNRLRERVTGATKNSDIVRRRWLLMDFDPVRPTGISSTEAEHEAALNRAKACRDFLSADGWPLPIYADSGNGAHLSYLIDLPNDDASSRLLKQCLKVLAWKFGDAVVEVDQTTSDAAQLCKAYGTLAAKGDDTADRPHRIAKILEAPERLIAVPVDLLEVLAATAPPEEPKQHTNGVHGNSQVNGWDLEHWIAEHNLPVVSRGTWNGGKKWILNPCPWNPDHTNRSAYIVQFASGAIGAGCHHNGCAGNDWHALRELYEPGHKQRRQSKSAKSDDDVAWDPPIPFTDFARPEFPTSRLSVISVLFVTALATFTQTPTDLPAMLLLGLAGAALAKKIRIVARPGWVEPTNLYTVVALPPGNRKSAVFAEMLAPVLEHERQECQRLRPEIADKESARRTLEARLRNAETKAAKTEDANTRLRAAEEAKSLAQELSNFAVPAMPQFFADDVTVEKLTSLLAEQGGRMLIASAEGTIFEIAKGRYSETPNFDVFLKGHAGDPIRTNRVGRVQDYIQQPAISMALRGHGRTNSLFSIWNVSARAG
jgi:hypothetical protein